LGVEDMARLKAKGKINPPLRPAAEHDKLWALCAAGQVDMITSDHAPWLPEYKNHPNIFDNASGAPGVQTIVPMIYSEGVAKGRLTIHDMARLLSQAPAEIFGLTPQKGQIRVGADADLTVIDPNAQWVLDDADQLSSAGWSPYHGWRMTGKVTKTILRGQVIYDGEQVLAEPGMGNFVPGRHGG
jgi:allantoinase